MTETRRDFVKLAVAGGVLAMSAPGFAAAETARRPLRVLVLGGTGFIGPHLVQRFLDRGHTVTIFNRGRTNTHLFPKIEKLKGDRDGALDSLKGHTWDAVVDNTGYVPRLVRDSAQLLRNAVKGYLFTSTRQTYRNSELSALTEEAPLKVLSEPGSEDTFKHYGALKALCEQEVRKAFPNASLVVRPGLITGPGDRSGRFTYWVDRVARGGAVMAPGQPDQQVQYIDVRDLSEWYVRIVEAGITGTYNATGPHGRLSMAELLYGLRALTAGKISFTWVAAEFLAAQGLGQRQLAPWLSPVMPGSSMTRISNARAVAAGLTLRPLADTAGDILDWLKPMTNDSWRRASRGLTPEREAEILAAWSKQKA